MASDLERDLKAMILPGAADQKMRSIGGKNTPPPPMPKLGMDVSVRFNSYNSCCYFSNLGVKLPVPHICEGSLQKN